MVYYCLMSVFIEAFVDEIVKLGSGESGKDVVMAEALGPIPSAVRGYRKEGLKGAAKGAGGYVAGGGIGALLGLLAAKGLHPLLGEGRVGRAAELVLPAVGGVLGGLRGAKMSGVT
jgi:hypothetical protein